MFYSVLKKTISLIIKESHYSLILTKKSIQRHEKGMNIPIENITVSYLQYYMTDFIEIIIEAK